MAVNFGLLQPAAPVSAFFQGQQDVQAQAERNMLRQQQAEKLQFERENMLAQRSDREALAAQRRAQDARAAQRQQFLTGAAQALAQGGATLDRPTLMKVLQSGVQADEPTLIQFAREGLKALDEEDLYRQEATRFGLPGAAAPTAAPANALAAPAAPAGVTRDTVQNMMLSPSARIREQGKALATTLEKEAATPSDVATMKALGFPLTAAGYAQFRDAQRQERMLSPEEEAQRIRIARESRPLPQPREPKGPGSPVAVVDDATGRVKYVTPEEAIGKTPASATEGLAPKEIQKREATFPKVTAALRSFETQADTLAANLTKLRDHPGLSGITGFVFGRTPAITAEARSAKADLDNILARGGFAELAAMRQASPTGGALGNISNQEVQYLRQAFGALDPVQDTETFKQKINDVIAQLQTSKRNVREEYDNTYEYRAQRAAAAGGAPAPGGFPKPPQAAIDQLKSGKGTDAQFDEIFGPGAAARARRQ